MKSKKKVTALEEAYKKTKVSELENIVESILAESTSLSLLLESPEELADLSEKIATFEQIAESSKTLTPNLSKFILENCKNIFESVKQPDLLENSLNGLVVASEILRTQNPSYEFHATTKAARCLTFESLDRLIVVCDELKKLNEKQLGVFKEYAPELRPILTNNFIKEEVYSNSNKIELILEAANLDQLAKTLDQLEAVINRLGDKFKYTRQGFDKFHQDFENFAMDSKGGEKAQNNLIAQARLIVAMFNTFGRIWPNFTRVFRRQFSSLSGIPNDDVDVIPNLKTAREQIRKGFKDQLSFKGGLIAKIARMLPGTKYPTSLNPDVVIQDVLNILAAPETANADTKNLKEGLETLNKLMGSLTSQTANIAPAAAEPVTPDNKKESEANSKEATATPSDKQTNVGQSEPMSSSQKPAQDPLKALGLGILSLPDQARKLKATKALRGALGDLKVTATTLQDLGGEIARLYKQNFDTLNKTETAPSPTSGESWTVTTPPSE